MQRSALGLRVPMGMHDLLPDEMALLEGLERQTLDLFRRWAYRRILTPTLEYAACVQPDVDREDQLYKFFDRQGRILALRPELTPSIARLVSTRLRASQPPLRLCYGADVFRNSTPHFREFRQVGVELVGSAEVIADAEVVALAVKSLEELGIKDFQFNLGHMGIFAGLMRELALPAELRESVEEKLARKDMVGIESLVLQSDLPEKTQDILLKLPHLHGGEEILDEVLSWSGEPGIRAATEGLRQVYRYLRDFGAQRPVALDLGILRGFSYYTGVIFEGYVPGVGFPVAEGGRYDSLYADFGYDQPATGFAIHLGSLLGLFPMHETGDADILVFGRDIPKVIRRCLELRGQGKRVEMTLGSVTRAEAGNLAEKKGIPLVEKV
ncbi:ATP phosphoribosyltransferase regulatory subunit [Peptococcaceae bacterium CEB3]|nr:ATP phosphoribosyltransferase regulatory subunit [Peptococcaceae bacterium CEB3]